MPLPVPSWLNSEKVGTTQMGLVSAAILDLYNVAGDFVGNAGNGVLSGFSLTALAGNPITFSVAAGIAYTSNFRQAQPSGNVSMANGDTTNHRYDIVALLYAATAGTDLNGYPTQLNNATYVVVPGTASSTPTLPALPSSNYVQVAWVDVPPAATLANQCTIHNSYQYTLRTLADLSVHISTDVRTGSPHGVQATSAGGTEVNRLAYTDGAGAVGAVKGGGQWFTGIYPGDPTDGFIISSQNGPSATDGMYLEYQPPTKSGATNTRKQLNITGPGAVPLDQFNVSATIATFGGAVKSQNGVNLGPGAAPPAPDVHSDGASIYIEALAGYIFIRPQGYGIGTNASAFDPNGRLGVNTTAPQYTLDVNGDIHTAAAVRAGTGIFGFLNDGGGQGRGFGTPGSVTGNAWACTDGSGAVGLANLAKALQNAGVTIYVDSGVTTAFNTGQNGNISTSPTITFAKPFTQPPFVVGTVLTSDTPDTLSLYLSSRTATTCQFKTKIVFGSTQPMNVQILWLAIGS